MPAPQALKNAAELDGMREAHIRDAVVRRAGLRRHRGAARGRGLALGPTVRGRSPVHPALLLPPPPPPRTQALAEFFQWLEESVASGAAVDEASAAEHLR